MSVLTPSSGIYILQIHRHDLGRLHDSAINRSGNRAACSDTIQAQSQLYYNLRVLMAYTGLEEIPEHSHKWKLSMRVSRRLRMQGMWCTRIIAYKTTLCFKVSSVDGPSTGAFYIRSMCGQAIQPCTGKIKPH